MKKPMIQIHNISTNEIVNREMTEEEFAQFESDREASLAKANEEKLKTAEKAALLERLGMTADEAALLLS